MLVPSAEHRPLGNEHARQVRERHLGSLPTDERGQFGNAHLFLFGSPDTNGKRSPSLFLVSADNDVRHPLAFCPADTPAHGFIPIIDIDPDAMLLQFLGNSKAVAQVLLLGNRNDADLGRRQPERQHRRVLLKGVFED